MAGISATPLYGQLVPTSSVVGWPIPVRHRPGWDGATKVFLRLPLFRFEATDGGSNSWCPPFATVTLLWDTGQPMEFLDLRYSRPWPRTGDTEPVISVQRRESGNRTRDNEVHRLLILYDQLFDSLLATEPFAGSAEAEFRVLLRAMVEPELEPYYRALGPGFWNTFLGPGPTAADRAQPGGVPR
jgi:hypothetical protein